jgi:hypothetical protein
MFKSSIFYGHYIITLTCLVGFKHCLRRGVSYVLLLHVLVILCFGLGVTFISRRCKRTYFNLQTYAIIFAIPARFDILTENETRTA